MIHGRPESIRLVKKVIQLGCVWATILCLIVQSVGAAAGGVLCLGCSNIWGGVAIASAPCTPANDCCASHCEGESSRPHQNEDDEDHPPPDCGCFDVTLSPNAGTLAKPPSKIILSTVQFTVPAAVLTANSCVAAESRRIRGARDGPPLVRTLQPWGQRTVLLI